MNDGLVGHDPATGQDLEPPLLDQGPQLGFLLLRSRQPPLGQEEHLGPGESHVCVGCLENQRHYFETLKKVATDVDGLAVEVAHVVGQRHSV